MRLQEAKDLKIGEAVFVIGRDRNVYKKIVTGTRLMNNESIDITYIAPAEKNLGSGLFLPHDEVFLGEKEALKQVLLAHKNLLVNIEFKVLDIETQIKKLERRNHDVI